MPMSRYEIRNEYSLADPELYRAADKDDPEALLEGVSMAGLVGVLRQLGDLAEFAAEVFHNLHEEVMVTAARGHGLMIRVQQLETEVPSIERAFLSQTDHSSFFHHAGVDWHPNLRIDQNLVTQGDLPRFIMDSYEECRAPPRLFLLDKLHQLFLEELTENGVSNPSRRAKLKRRLNGFPFDSKTGKSYMEKLLKSPPPDHKVLHEVTVDSSPLMLTAFDHNECGLDVLEVRSVSPDSENVGKKRSLPSSPDREGIMENPSMYEPSEVPVDDKICEIPNSYPSIATDGGISSTLDKVTSEKVIAVDAESNREGSLTGYQSDDIASEVDNYVDAPSTIESEAESELRVKNDFTSSHIKNEPLLSDANEEYPHTRSSDSQSTGESTISDEGNNSSRKEISSSSSDSPSTLAETPQSETISARRFPSADIPEVDETVDASSYQKTADEDFPVDQHPKPVVSDDTCPNAVAITNHKSDYEQVTNESIPALTQSDSGVVRKNVIEGPKLDEMDSTLDDEEKKANLVMDPPCSLSVSYPVLRSGDDSPRSSAGEHLVDEQDGERTPSISTVPYEYCHTIDISDKVTLDFLHEDESDQEDRNLVQNMASTYNLFNVRTQNTNGTPSEMISSESLIPGKSDGEFQKLPNDVPSDYPDMVHNGDNIKSMVSKEEKLIDGLDNEDSGVSTDSPNQFPSFMEAFLKKKLEETSPANAQAIDGEGNHSNSSIDNQVCSENSMLSHQANSPDWPQAGLDAHEGDVIPEEETTVNETFVLETPKSCEVLGLLGTGITHDNPPNDSEAQESSCCTPEYLKEPAATSGSVEMDGTSSTGQEFTEISSSADRKSLNEVHIQLDESDSEAEKSNTVDMASAVPALSDNMIKDDVPSPVGLNKLVEEHIHLFEDSGLDELENEKKCLSENHGESDLVEKVDQTKASRFETVLCDTNNNDHPKSEVDDGLELVHPATIQSPVEQSLLNREQVNFQRSGLENHVSDAPSLSVDNDAEESIVQELPSQLHQELLHSSEISSEVPPLLPINHHIDAPGFPKDPLGSIFPPSNPFSETNQMADLPPLPPLPPVQWRMGKLQHASSSTDGEMMKQKGLFPQLISLPIASTDDASSYPPTTPSDAVDSSQPTTSTNNDTSSPEETKHPMIQIANEPTSKEEKVENSFSDDASSYPPTAPTDAVDSSPPTTSTNDDTSSPEETKHPVIQIANEPISKEEKVEKSFSDDASSYPPTTPTDAVDSSPPTTSTNDDTSSPEVMKHSMIQIVNEPASKEEKVEKSFSCVKPNPVHETSDLPPKSENKQQQLVMPTSESEFISPAEEDGVANGSRTGKLPRPRNPLFDEVDALDKSKLRKVTDRVRPQIQKVDERDSLLEQIRTKSFNLKPAMASRPSIRGPNTNLKVAAILQKANAIRQRDTDLPHRPNSGTHPQETSPTRPNINPPEPAHVLPRKTYFDSIREEVNEVVFTSYPVIRRRPSPLTG
ncbi:hypothetical protein DH2020_048010 [Rehmannia glutinosa]|uniref:Protein SCAR n=1 Tax=Rehmannia glutinosa TaxID=99300 RepID=A0ABR0U6T6_REHGL